MNPILLIGAAGIGAYLLGRNHRVDSSSPTTNKPQQPDANATAKNPAKDPNAIPENEALGLGTRDVSGDISDDEKHPLPVEESIQALSQEGAVGWAANDVNDSKTGYDMGNSQLGNKSQDELFFRWFWLPASKVKLTELTAFEWRMVFALLGGTVHRRIDREKRYANMVLDIRQRQEMAKWGKLVGQLYSSALNAMVPGVGSVFTQILNTGINSALNTAGKDLAQDAKAMGAAGSSYRFSVDPHNLDPPAQMLLAPCWRNGEGDSIIDDKMMPWLNEQGMIWDTPKLNGDVPTKYVGTADFPWPPLSNLGTSKRYRFAAQRRFWCLTQYGLYLPWICDEFFNRQLTTKQQVNLMARVYKAICTLSVWAFPDTSIKDPIRTKFAPGVRPKPTTGYTDPVYYYNSPLGEVLGSIFPPTDEDTYIVDAEGFMLMPLGCRFPEYDYDDSVYGGSHFHLPSPATPQQKADFDKQYADRVTLGDKRKADSQAKIATMTTNIDYLKSLFQRRGTKDVDGIDVWADHNWTWTEIKLLTPDMIAALPIQLFNSNAGRKMSITSAMLAELTADQKREMNKRLMAGANSQM
jgi:hypothetical protein